MTSPLQPHQFGDLYHGTASRMRPGTMITPGRPSNYEDVTADTDAEHVFATNDLTTAWHHAQNASSIRNAGKVVYRRGMSPDDFGENPENVPRPIYRPSAPRVYPVTPTGDVHVDQEALDAGQTAPDPDAEDPADAFQSRHPFRVTGRDIGSEAQRETVDNFGADTNPPHNPLDHINNAVGVHETFPQMNRLNKHYMNGDQFGGGDW